MRIQDVKSYVGKVCALDFMNGTMPMLTEIVSVDEESEYVKTKDWVLILPDPQNPQGGVNFIPYGAMFPHTAPLKSANIKADRIGVILDVHANFAAKYREFTSPIARVPDLSQIDLSKFGAGKQN